MPSETTDTSDNRPLFSIGAEGVNAEKIMADIKARVAEKTARGAYRDMRIAQAEKANLVNLSDDESFLKYYLECLRDAVFVDINDFEICERRRLWSAFFVVLKKIIWNSLKFYTYRLWSQQNQINGLLVTAVESLDEKYRARIEKLERRLSAPDQTNCTAETQRSRRAE